MARSESLDFLTRNSITALSFETEQNGLLALVDKKIDAFVYNELILMNLVKTKFPGRVYVLSETFDPYYVGIALAQGRTLRVPINPELLKILSTEEWDRLVERYIGPIL